MARPKKVKEADPPLESVSQKPQIASLAIDYPSEGLNTMARKINEIIECING